MRFQQSPFLFRESLSVSFRISPLLAQEEKKVEPFVGVADTVLLGEGERETLLYFEGSDHGDGLFLNSRMVTNRPVPKAAGGSE